MSKYKIGDKVRITDTRNLGNLITNYKAVGRGGVIVREPKIDWNGAAYGVNFTNDSVDPANPSDWAWFHVDDLVPTIRTAKRPYQIGDRLRVHMDARGDCGNVRLTGEDGEYLVVESVNSDGSIRSYTGYDAYGDNLGRCWGCYNETNTELITQGDTMEDNVKQPYQRKTYKLLRDSPTMKKGALLQEQCDDGTQPYIMLNAETHSLDPSFTISIAKRSIVEEQPTWFQEVFKVNPEYMTQEELEQFDMFKVSLKGNKRKASKTTPTAAKTSKGQKTVSSQRIAAFMAVYNDSKSLAEVASRMNLTLNTAKTYKAQARRDGYTLAPIPTEV